MIIGVDPGYRTGIAIVDKAKVVFATTVSGKQACSQVLELRRKYSFGRAAVEMPKLGLLYGRYATELAQKRPSWAQMGRSVGLEEYKAILAQHPRNGGACGPLTAGQVKIAQNVGQNVAMTQVIVTALKNCGVKVKEVTPKKGQTKWDVGYWCRIFDWKSGRVPSEHARDAACLGFLFENWPGFNLPI